MHETTSTFPLLLCPSRVLLTDADTTVNETLRYYGTLGRVGSHLPLNYNLRQLSEESSQETSDPGMKIRDLVQQWLGGMPEEETANWVVSLSDI